MIWQSLCWKKYWKQIRIIFHNFIQKDKLYLLFCLAELLLRQGEDDKMATIKDVAQLAGISKTLVSRYINNQKGVSPESQQKIMAAIKELNYRPNGIARSLVLQKTHTIGIVVDDLCATFIFRLIEGLERGAEEFDKDEKYNVIFCNSNGDIARKERHINFLTQGRVDGIVIYGSLVYDDGLIQQLAQANYPFMLIENDIEGVDVDKVVIDNIGGAFTATEHLIKLGHRRIAHIGGNMNLKITLDRMNGYVRALQKYNVPVDQSLIIFPDFSDVDEWKKRDESMSQYLFFDRGYVEMKKLIEKGQVPEAIFFATDLSAFGAIKALVEAGLKVPEDVSIIGFDDEYTAAGSFGCKPITTMRQPLKQAGYVGIQKLVHSLAYPHAPKERILLKTELIIRDSTCANKRQAAE
jgi:DNA-binding LacI/PurR family transcriptional regulator